jgi:hypothetical protein
MPGMFLAQNTQNALWCQTHTHKHTKHMKTQNTKKIETYPCFNPNSSTHFVGSTPGNRTKNTGVEGLVSLKVWSMSKGGCSTKIGPNSIEMKC